MAKEEWDSLRESIQSTTDTRKLTKNAIRKMKLRCPDGSRNRVQPVRRSKDATRHMVNLLHIHSEISLRNSVLYFSRTCIRRGKFSPKLQNHVTSRFLAKMLDLFGRNNISKWAKLKRSNSVGQNGSS